MRPAAHAVHVPDCSELDVEIDLAHSFTEIGPIHLIAAAIAELRCGAGGLAEGTVDAEANFDA